MFCYLWDLMRASSRIEHLGFVCNAGIDVFHIDEWLWFVSCVLLACGLAALARDCLEWQHDADAAEVRAKLARKSKED